MRFKFIGKSRHKSLNLENGKVYDLQVVFLGGKSARKYGLEVEVTLPFHLSYKTVGEFRLNWTETLGKKNN